MFAPYPWIKRWACSLSWAVAPVLQYFRALRGELSPPSIKFINSASFLAYFARVCFALWIPYLDFEKNHGSVNASLEPGTSKANARHPKALSTSFEKTCMRQIHCHDRLNAMVNKGPYHAQGLFKLKRTQCLTRNVSVILECAFLILETCVVIKSCNASKCGWYMAFSCKMIAKKKYKLK